MWSLDYAGQITLKNYFQYKQLLSIIGTFIRTEKLVADDVTPLDCTAGGQQEEIPISEFWKYL